MKSGSTTKDAREALRNAQLDLAQAESTLQAAQGATSRRAPETIVREAEDHEAVERSASSALASEVKAAR